MSDLTASQKAYALLWRDLSVARNSFVSEARKILLQSMTHAEQREAIAWVQQKHPVTDAEIARQ